MPPPLVASCRNSCVCDKLRGLRRPADRSVSDAAVAVSGASGRQSTSSECLPLLYSSAPHEGLGRFLAEQGRDKEGRELYRDIIARPWPRFRNETVSEAKRRLSKL